MEGSHKGKTIRMNFRYNTKKKILERDYDDGKTYSKYDEMGTTVTRKVAKIKMTQSGKQVSFSKKTEQIPLLLAEIGKLNFTPPKVKVVSMKYKPSKDHIKTPFRINKLEVNEDLTDKISLKKSLFNDDEKEDKEEKKDNSSNEEKREKVINENTKTSN